MRVHKSHHKQCREDHSCTLLLLRCVHAVALAPQPVYVASTHPQPIESVSAYHQVLYRHTIFCTCVCSYVRAHDGACAVASPVHVSSVMTSHREHRQTRTYTNMHVQIHTYIHTHPRIHSYIHINIHTNVTCDRTPHPRDHQGVWSPFLSHL